VAKNLICYSTYLMNN